MPQDDQAQGHQPPIQQLGAESSAMQITQQDNTSRPSSPLLRNSATFQHLDPFYVEGMTSGETAVSAKDKSPKYQPIVKGFKADTFTFCGLHFQASTLLAMFAKH